MTLHHCTDLDCNLSDFKGCFWLVYRLLLIIGILCCCSTGYFIRRRVPPYPPPERPDFNVAFTRQPIISPGNLSLCLRFAYMHYVVSFPVCILSLCVGRIASGWLSQLWRLRDCSHFHHLPSADPPRSRDCSVFSPAVPLQTAPSFLWSGHAGLAEEINRPSAQWLFLTLSVRWKKGIKQKKLNNSGMEENKQTLYKYKNKKLRTLKLHLFLSIKDCWRLEVSHLWIQ